ncbi:DapH/DapD/GlmU-related protein [uncultured Duncaniella sp.]|uniref:acyltransferase n=1 Tax=uncultured Duncaniella sp. TaxID=2768039 RepID=UPI002731071E|nr:acyltransferase [uncultured Duncaniella sp.]
MSIIRNFIQKTFDSIVLVCYPFIKIYYSHFYLRINNLIGDYFVSTIHNRGIDLRIHGFGRFTSPERIKIGDYCRIGNNAHFHGSGGLKIGNNVQISRNVTIYTANHNFNSATHLPYDNTELYGFVTIGDNVWIGMNVSILPNVTIGDNAIIGMGAIITKDVAPRSIVVGNNKVVGFRDLPENPLMFGKEFPNA